MTARAPIVTGAVAGGGGGGLGPLTPLLVPPADGSVIVGNGGLWTEYPVGADGDTLIVVGGFPTWAPASDVLGALAPVTAAPADGSLILGDAGLWEEYPVGADGQYLTVVTGFPVWTTIPPAVLALHPLTPAADKLAYYTGATTAALTDFTAFGRSLVGAADAATARTTLAIRTVSAVIDFGSGVPAEDTLTRTTVAAAWVTGSTVFACNVRGEAPDHDPEDAAAEGVTAYADNVVPGASFDIIISAPQGSWGRYAVTATAIG